MAAANAIVYVGAQAPEALTITVTQGTSGVNLAQVSAATLYLKDPSGNTPTWACAISAQSSTSLTLTHTFSPTDVVLSGNWIVYAKMTIPGGIVRTIPQSFQAVDPFG